jgi:hypothetical protein
MRSSAIERGLPGRNSSCKPAMRRATKRRRHLPTVASVVAKRRATALLVAPAAHASTMLARRTSAAGSDRDRGDRLQLRLLLVAQHELCLRRPIAIEASP